MYISASQRRLGVVIIASSLIISAALVARTRNQASPVASQSAAADIAVAPTRTPIPITDSNGDGVPDWQENLVKTIPLAAATSTASSSVATSTLTERFSKSLFQQIVEAKVSGGFGKSTQQIAQQNVDNLAKAAQDPLITTQDIVTSSDNSPAALAQFGTAVASIIADHNQNTGGNEVTIFNRALQDQNPAELQPLDAKLAVYQDILKQTEQITVPSSVVTKQLALLNSYQAVLNDIKAMRGAFNDPMYALLRLKRYQSDVDGLYLSSKDLAMALVQGGATWPANSVVYTIFSSPTNQQ